TRRWVSGRQRSNAACSCSTEAPAHCMADVPLRICVFGAGAIGGFVAAHLAQVGGLEVSVVARGAHLAAIRAQGLRVVSPKGELRARVRASDRADELGPQDVVFIALKQHQVTAALSDLATLLGPQTTVVPPTTGIPYLHFHA